MIADRAKLFHVRLHRIRAAQDRIAADMGGLWLRASAVEQSFGQIRSQLGALQRRMDSFDERLTGVERRSDTVEVRQPSGASRNPIKS